MRTRRSNLTGTEIPLCSKHNKQTGRLCESFATKLSLERDNPACHDHGGARGSGRPILHGKRSKEYKDTVVDRQRRLDETLTSKAITKKDKQEIEKYGLNAQIEKYKKDNRIRDFNEYLATVYVLIDNIKREVSKLPGLVDVEDGVPILPDEFLIRIGALTELATKILEREAKVKYAEKFIITVDELTSFKSQFNYGMHSICSGCDKLKEVAAMIEGIKLRMKEDY